MYMEAVSLWGSLGSEGFLGLGLGAEASIANPCTGRCGVSGVAGALGALAACALQCALPAFASQRGLASKILGVQWGC